MVVTDAPNEVIPSESLFSSKCVKSSSNLLDDSDGKMYESSAEMLDSSLASETKFCTVEVILSTSQDWFFTITKW